MKFNDIIGQEGIKKVLIGTARENRIPHAQLFLGHKGCGKLALAIAFAQYRELLKQNRLLNQINEKQLGATVNNP